ncbi:MAG: PAS domain S-box protein [Alphaproteobacteria bacterium]
MSLDSSAVPGRFAVADGVVRPDGAAEPADRPWLATQLRHLYGTLPLAVAISLVIAVVLAAMQWNAVPRTNAVIWLAILVVVGGVRTGLSILFTARGGETGDHRVWLLRFRVGAAVAGMAWGLGSYLLFPPGDIPHQVFLAFAIAGISAGAASSMSADRMSLLLFATPALVTPVVMFLADGGGLQIAMGAMIALYFAFVAQSTWRSHRWLKELVDLRSKAMDRAEQLRASESRYQDLFENSTDLIQAVAPDGRIMFVNRAWRETLGYADDEIVGRSIFDFISEASRPHCMDLFRQIMSGDDAGLATVELQARDGRPVALEGRINVRFEDGRPVSTRAIFRDVSARRAAEQKLLANQRMLDSIFENLPAMVFLKTADELRYERLNRAGEALLGYSREEFIGRTDFEVVPEAMAESFVAVDRQVLASASERHVSDEAVTTRGGERRHLRTAKIALRDADGRPTHLLGVSIDITEQMRAEAALREMNATLERRVDERTAALAESERFNRATLDAIGAHLAVLSEDGRILATNAAWRRQAEDSDRDWQRAVDGDNYLDACERTTDGDNRESALEIAAGIRDVGNGRHESFLREYPCHSRAGLRWHLCRVSRFEVAGNARLVVTHDDVTDIHETRERLAARERLIETLERVSPVGLFQVNAAGDCDFVNRRYCEITGLTEAEAMNLGWQNAVHPDDRERVFGTWETAVSERSYAQVEYRFLHKDGAVRWVIGQVVEIVADDGGIAGYVGTLTDITDRRTLEAQLAQSTKMEAIGKLTGGMAHDFNNYLGVIIGNLDLVQESETADRATAPMVEAALNGALRAADLTKSLLAFSHRQPLDPRTADINGLMRGTIAMLRRTLGEDIVIHERLADAVWPVRIDHAQFDSTVVNLASNARDAMPKGGALTFATRNTHLDAHYAETHPYVAPGDYVLVEVSDTGQGMDAETLGRVFEPFFSTKPQGHGTGLGLSMVYGFVKQSGGHINLYSEPDHGTSVRIYLPVQRDAAGVERSSAAATSRPLPTGHETILVVEDNEQMRRTAVVQLTALGYKVVEADHGEAALALLEGESVRPDLMFTDIVMPGRLDGYQLAKAAAALRADMRVLLTSGFPGDTLNQHGKHEPGMNLLGKPYRKEDLARAIRQALEGPTPMFEGP